MSYPRQGSNTIALGLETRAITARLDPSSATELIVWFV